MEMAIKAEPHDRTPPHPMAAAYADQPQWRAEMVGGAQLGHAYAPQVSWQSPPYAPPSPHLQPSPMHQQPSPMHQQPSPMHQQPSPMHQQPSPMHQQPSPMHQQPSPMHVQQVVSPGLHPTSPYAVHLLGAQQMQHQQQMHMASLQVGAASPMGASPAASPALMQPGAMSMPMGLQPTMDPVMADLGAPTYTQMDSTVNSTPSLTSLLQQAGDDDVSYTSGDLAHLSSLLADRHDLSDSLTRLSTRDLLQP